MAEFVEVFETMRLICHQCDSCEDCPAFADELVCAFDISNRRYDPSMAEELALRHMSGNVYPTWKEWQEKQFPQSANTICPLVFCSDVEIDCDSLYTCDECRNQTIPVDIAKKLGIKPFAYLKENNDG